MDAKTTYVLDGQEYEVAISYKRIRNIHFRFDGEKYTYDQNRPVIWELAEGLLLHNVKEYRHLAEILPEVYAEFKDNFRVGLD